MCHFKHFSFSNIKHTHHRYFIDSGTVEVTTEDGSHARRTNGDFFGEGGKYNTYAPKLDISSSVVV